MAAYRRASRLFPGCHLANLYIGMEYLRQNNYQNALLQFNQAKSICSTDPNIFNEIGVTFYKQGNFEAAQENLGMALSFCKDSSSAVYESILLNLAHCHRKNKDFESAVDVYQQCLSINSKAPGTLCALGLTFH